MSERVRALLLGVVVVLAGVAVAGVGTATAASVTTETATALPPNGHPLPSPAAPQTECDFTAVYERTIDAVVQIRRDGGLGSGFVFRRFDGNDTVLVATNQHVVTDAPSVAVAFSDGTIRDGTVLGTDVFSDLAVVRVADAPDVASALRLAGAQPRPGDLVAALGSPFGLEATITQGIVSGVNRSLPSPAGSIIPDTVQTDAAINPGNSGGPLVTCAGRVVGVNTAGGGENVGFAVSADLARRVLPALAANGEYRHPFIGVRTGPVTPALATANDLDATTGIYVDEVVSGGPADGLVRGSTGAAVVDGVRVPTGGDVVVAVDEFPVRSGDDLSNYVATQASPGETVRLTVVRDGERQTVNVTLGTRPQPPQA